MYNRKDFRHYYDPAEWLDIEWQKVANKGFVSVSEAAVLTGVSKQHVYQQIKDGKLKACVNEGKQFIEWRRFVYWAARRDVLDNSPLCPPSYTLYYMISVTGFQRCWIFRFVQRYNIRSYYVGNVRRFDKHDVDDAWNVESQSILSWITIDVSTKVIDKVALIQSVVHKKIRTTTRNGVLLFNASDIKQVINENKQVSYE